LEAGLQWRALTARFSAEPLFSQTIATPELDASVQSTAVRLALGAVWPALGSTAIFVSMGGGVDIVNAGVQRVNDPALSPAAVNVRAVPMLRPELGYQIRFRAWRLMAITFADVALASTSYVVDRPGGLTPVATPWPVRPGGALVLAWAPALGGS
jgi:hypothetical protein